LGYRPIIKDVGLAHEIGCHDLGQGREMKDEYGMMNVEMETEAQGP
jgi:hypothetical protein